jgi:hypothetical protein
MNSTSLVVVTGSRRRPAVRNFLHGQRISSTKGSARPLDGGAHDAYADDEVTTMMCWLAGMSGFLLLLTGGIPGALSRTVRQPSNSIAQSDQAKPTGGVQLDLEPRRAQVFVDGAYAGRVDDFSGYYHHLSLPAGLHRIEVLTGGYMPLILTVIVAPDRTITYRQSLQEAPHGW